MKDQYTKHVKDICAGLIDVLSDYTFSYIANATLHIARGELDKLDSIFKTVAQMDNSVDFLRLVLIDRLIKGYNLTDESKKLMDLIHAEQDRVRTEQGGSVDSLEGYLSIIDGLNYDLADFEGYFVDSVDVWFCKQQCDGVNIDGDTCHKCGAKRGE